MSLPFKSEDLKLRDELFSHLLSGKSASTFSSPLLDCSSNQQPIVLNVAYDPVKHLISGTAQWDLNFMGVTGYAESLILGSKWAQEVPKVVAATGGLFAIPKAGNGLFLDPNLLSVRADAVIFEVSLLVFTPGLPKCYTNYVTMKWPV